MSLKRSTLSAMGIEKEKIDEIIAAHTETVNGLKEKIEEYEEAARKLPIVEQELADLKNKVKESEDADKSSKAELEKLQKKYDDLKSEHDTYKADVESKETRKAKEEAYKAILKDAGIPEKHYAKIIKYSNVDDVEIGEDGKIKTAADILKSIKEEWGDHVETQGQNGTSTSTPPANDGGSTPGISKAKQLANKYAEEHYGAPAKED